VHRTSGKRASGIVARPALIPTCTFDEADAPEQVQSLRIGLLAAIDSLSIKFGAHSAEACGAAAITCVVCRISSTRLRAAGHVTFMGIAPRKSCFPISTPQ
jgi:hypothetical protein